MTAPPVLDVVATLPRREGAAPYHTRSLDDIEYIVFHHTHAGEGRPTAESIAAYHTGPTAHNNFPSIAYALFVEADGAVKLTNDFTAVTWHAGQDGDAAIQGVSVKNWKGLAICFSGGEPTAAQLAGLKRARLYAEAKVGRPLLRYGHGDLSLTECPGQTWRTWKVLV